MRYGAGSGASRLVSGNMTIHRRLEEQLAEFKRAEACVLFGSGYLANAGIVPALAREGDVVFSDELNHASIVDGCRLARAETFVYDHCDTEHLEWGLRAGRGPRQPDRDRRRVLDGRRHRAAARDRGAGAALRRARDGGRGARHRLRRAGRPRRGGRRRPRGRGRRASWARSASRSAPTAPTCCCDKPMAKYLVNSARTLIFSTALPPPAVAAALACARAASRAAAPGRQAAAQRGACCARRWSSRAWAPARRRPNRPADRRRRRGGGRGQRAGARARRVRAGHPPADRPRRQLAAAPGGHGLAHQVGAARGRRRCWPRSLPAAAREAAERHAEAAHAAHSAPRVFDGLRDAA